VYSHLDRGNSSSLGVELGHSGRSDDPFPPAQVRSLAWLLRTLIEMSEGRLGPGSVHGHKDLDRRPAYESRGCAKPGCPVFVDADGRPLSRRVDPPESLFRSLARVGIVIPRPAGASDAELIRGEALPDGRRPAVSGR
jgi:N-acetyl-anhydromuramyl-L-alanine amidase AmpD